MLKLAVPEAEPSLRVACAWRSYSNKRGPLDPSWLQSRSPATGIHEPSSLAAPRTVSLESPGVSQAGCLHRLNGTDCAR